MGPNFLFPIVAFQLLQFLSSSIVCDLEALQQQVHSDGMSGTNATRKSSNVR
ncbi:ABC transporter ATP-binding protein [Sesbania bispinosa]|nr:ABC transporter ATP-binding protein [Sesbania bispinosa]